MNKILTIFSIIILSAVALSSGFVTVDAGASHNVEGYAWSDNIGWVSFNSLSDGSGVDYGVNVEVSGDFSGYAWSDNIGWIDFAPASGYPGAPNYGARFETDGSVTGWARALSYGDGWDGWIRMSGANYGVVFNDTTKIFEGYAWGSDVVGWLQFDAGIGGGSDNPVGCDTCNVTVPAVNLNADPLDLPDESSTTTLTWSTSNVDSCTSSWNGPGEALNNSTGEVLTPGVTTTYTLDCTGPSGNAIDEVTVTVPGGVTAIDDDTAELNENDYVNIFVLLNDMPTDAEIISITDPAKGSAVIINTGSSYYIRYIHSAGDPTGIDTFQYTIEKNGEQSTATVTVTIHECGDGTIQLNETCDDGASNGACPAYCSATCSVNVCSTCGNDICEDGESIFTCPQDCSGSFIEF